MDEGMHRLNGRVVEGDESAGEAVTPSARVAAAAPAGRDPVTGLLDRRGWQAALAAEERSGRRGRAVSVVLIDLDDPAGARRWSVGDAAVAACVQVLTARCRPGNRCARIARARFAVLAADCDVVSARALGIRLRAALCTAGVAASLGSATRRVGEDLAAAARRADRAVQQARSARQLRVRPTPARRRPRPVTVPIATVGVR